MASNCVVAATFLSMAVLFANATHFRAGIIQWRPVGERTVNTLLATCLINSSVHHVSS